MKKFKQETKEKRQRTKAFIKITIIAFSYYYPTVASQEKSPQNVEYERNCGSLYLGLTKSDDIVLLVLTGSHVTNFIIFKDFS